MLVLFRIALIWTGVIDVEVAGEPVAKVEAAEEAADGAAPAEQQAVR